jgi:propionyl-CoA carboxylase beta chain
VLFRREIEQSADPAKTRAEKILGYQERFNGPFEALSKQFAHAAIRPRETRKRLIQALEILRHKKEERPRKKHGVMPV